MFFFVGTRVGIANGVMGLRNISSSTRVSDRNIKQTFTKEA